MIIKADYAVQDWLAEAGRDSISPFTKFLIDRADRYGHVLARARPTYDLGSFLGVKQFDPKVICVAIESASIEKGHGYDNVRGAMGFLSWVIGEKDYIISEGANGLADDTEIEDSSVFGFLKRSGNLQNLSFADNMEAYSEMRALQERGEPAPLHRIEEREEAIARRLWRVLGSSMGGRVYMVLDHHHLMSLNKDPIDSKRPERDSYLLYDFMDAEHIPHAVVAPKIPKLYKRNDAEALEFDWMMAIIGGSRGCHTYQPVSAELDRNRYYLNRLIEDRPDLKERLTRITREHEKSEAVVVRSLDRDKISKEINKSSEEFRLVYQEIQKDREIARRLAEFEKRDREEWEERMKRIKGVDI